MGQYTLIRNCRLCMKSVNLDIIVIVVLYKTKIRDSISILSLEHSMSKADWEKIDMMVYDNSPEYNLTTNFSSDIFHFHYVPDHSNSGVSHAYNLAARLGNKLGKKYILLLDQDTEIAESFCQELGALMNSSYNLIFPLLSSNSSILSPCVYKWGRGFVLPAFEREEGIKSLKNRNFLNSGSVVSLSLFEKVGGFDESIPLYYSDFNFFNRVKKVQSSYYLMKTICYHEMASNDETDLDKFAYRFQNYCFGAIRCYSSINGKLLMIFNILSRSIKVGVRNRSSIFLRIAIKSIYANFIG